MRRRGIFCILRYGKQGDWQRVISFAMEAYSRVDMLFQNAGLYKIYSIFSRQQENDSNVLCINYVGIEIKQLTSSFMKQQEEWCSVIYRFGYCEHERTIIYTLAANARIGKPP